MKALDLYCSAGGATRGLQQAGFHVTGVDLRAQPNYCGDAFVRADALAYLATADLAQFDFIWASPPCQRFTAMARAPGAKGEAHPDLIAPTREALFLAGKPWCIENVVGAPLRDPIMLCGTAFNLRVPEGELRRHRLFETSFPLAAPRCVHGDGGVIGVYGGHCRRRSRPAGKNHQSGSNLPITRAFELMRIDWRMTGAEISEAIPPIPASLRGLGSRRRRRPSGP